MKTCSIDGCERPVKAWGWCKPHYERWWRNGDTNSAIPILPWGGQVQDPTPHDQLTYERWNLNTTPLPPLEAIHNDYRARYAAANERDGYLHDPQYIAAVQQWKSGDLPDALPMAAD